jgi:hypothetical protein
LTVCKTIGYWSFNGGNGSHEVVGMDKVSKAVSVDGAPPKNVFPPFNPKAHSTWVSFCF